MGPSQRVLVMKKQNVLSTVLICLLSSLPGIVRKGRAGF